MKGILKRNWNIIFFTTIYLVFITDKETPNKYVYTVVLCVFILMIDIFLKGLEKRKNEN